MEQILQILEKVGVTRDLVTIVSLFAGCAVLIFGGGKIIAVVTRNWPQKKWEQWSHSPSFILMIFGTLLALLGRPPASVAGIVLGLFGWAIVATNMFRRHYPKSDPISKKKGDTS